MQLIKSLIFNIFLYVGLITILILAIPTLILPLNSQYFWETICKIYSAYFKNYLKYESNLSWNRKS